MAELDLEHLVRAVLQQVLERLGTSASTVLTGPPISVQGGKRTPLVAANWKMNAPVTPSAGAVVPEIPDEMRNRIEAYVAALKEAPVDRVETALMPPAVLLYPVRNALTDAGVGRVALGAQDIHPEPSGAHTGELSAPLMRSMGATWTLVGHSERRLGGETDTQVNRKVHAGLEGGMKVMLCVGESAEQRKTGATFRVLRLQVTSALAGTALQPPPPHRLALAYEPVWAIGTGVRAEPEQIQEACAFIRQLTAEVYDFNRARQIRILYGGSVTPDNAAETMKLPDVDGLLVGGASLKGHDFRTIVEGAFEAFKAKEPHGG